MMIVSSTMEATVRPSRARPGRRPTASSPAPMPASPCGAVSRPRPAPGPRSVTLNGSVPVMRRPAEPLERSTNDHIMVKVFSM
jgi:hypothetical protein